jgi:hypothetical protein
MRLLLRIDTSPARHEHTPRQNYLPAASEEPLSRNPRSARAAERSANRREFVLQHGREVRDDKNKGPNDKTKEHDVLRHCCPVFVLAQLVEKLPNFRQDTTP